MSSEYIWIIPVVLIILLAVSFFKEYQKNNETKENPLDSKKETELPDELILVKRVANISDSELRKTKRIYLLGALFSPVVLMSPLLIMFSNKEDVDVYEKLYEIMLDKPDLLIMMVLFFSFFFLYPFYLNYSKKNERIILTKEGISYSSIGISLFDFIMPGWNISWSNIKEIKLKSTFAPGRLSIYPISGKAKHVLLPQWAFRNSPKEKKFKSLFSAMHEQRLWQNDDHINNLPIVRYIKEVANSPISFDQGAINFDLFSDTHTRNSTIVLFALVFYAIIDFVANMETYLVSPPVWYFALFGVIVAILSIFYIDEGKASIGTGIVFGLLLGVASAIAFYPALLRLNQLTDSNGLREYNYVMGADGVFKNHNEVMPSIIMEPDEYWKSIGTDENYTFLIRKGGLEFYQLDMNDVYKRMRKWYCVKNKQEKCF